MVGAVFFDLWNTLVYCPTRDRIEEVISLLGLKIGYEDFMFGLRPMIFTDSNLGFDDYLKEYLKGQDITFDKALLSEAERLWRSRLEDTILFPETEEVLQDLKKDCKIGLISNLDESGAEYFKRRFGGIYALFDVVLFSCEVSLVKPDERIFRKALAQVGARPEDSWMVGDRIQDDITGAINAGMNPILIDREGKVNNPGFPVIRNLREIRQVIENENRNP